MKEKRMVYRLTGVIMAIAGAVLVIHIVPVFVWYIVLAVLIAVFVFFMLTT